MTKLLDQALEAVRRLPSDDQDEIARAMLHLAAQGEEPGAIAELDRRWAKVEAEQATVANEAVVQWLETWGTPAFKRWRISCLNLAAI